jgi:hypothetical protein
VLNRLAGRLLTGPLAFVLGGALDLGAFAVQSLRARVGRPASKVRRPAGRRRGGD